MSRTHLCGNDIYGHVKGSWEWQGKHGAKERNYRSFKIISNKYMSTWEKNVTIQSLENRTSPMNECTILMCNFIRYAKVHSYLIGPNLAQILVGPTFSHLGKICSLRADKKFGPTKFGSF